LVRALPSLEGGQKRMNQQMQNKDNAIEGLFLLEAAASWRAMVEDWAGLGEREIGEQGGGWEISCEKGGGLPPVPSPKGDRGWQFGGGGKRGKNNYHGGWLGPRGDGNKQMRGVSCPQYFHNGEEGGRGHERGREGKERKGWVTFRVVLSQGAQ